MANANTRLARSKGYVTFKAYTNKDPDGKIVKGRKVDSAWDSPESKRKSPKRFKTDKDRR